MSEILELSVKVLKWLLKLLPKIIICLRLQGLFKWIKLFRSKLARVELEKKFGKPKPEVSDFINSAKNNSPDEVRLFIEAECNINAVVNGRTALIVAAEEEHNEILDILLAEKNINVNIRDNEGDTALIAACRNGKIEAVKRLLGKADIKKGVNIKNNQGDTALMVASKYCHPELVNLLLNREDVDINSRNTKKDTAWIAVVKAAHNSPADKKQKYQEIEKLLKDKSADSTRVEQVRALLELTEKKCYDEKKGFNNEKFIKCVEEPNIEMLEKFLVAGQDVNAQNNDGDTFLIAACRNGKTEAVKYLLGKEDGKIDVNIKNNGGDTALIAACRNGKTEVVKLLLDKEDIKIDVDIKNNEGDTALIAACRNGKTEVAKLLLDKEDIKVDVDIKNKEGDTAWITAVKAGYTSDDDKKQKCGEIEKLLKEKSVDSSGVEQVRAKMELKKKNYHDGDKWFDNEEFIKCVDEPDIEMVKKFLAAGQDVNVRNSVGDTALIVAARNGYTDMVELLLQQTGIKVNRHNKKITPLLEAATLGHDDIRVLLEQKDAKEPDLERKVAKRQLENEGIFNHEEFVKCVDRGEILKVKKFLLAGQEINARNSVEDTALIVAARNGDAHMVKLLLKQKGIDVNLRNRDKVSALLEAATLGHDDIRVLLELKDAKEPDLERIVARRQLENEGIFNHEEFIKCVDRGEIVKVKKFLLAGQEINARNSVDDTALIVAARNGDAHMVKLLLQQEGIKVNLRNKKKSSALLEAATLGHDNIRVLLEQKDAKEPDLERKVAKRQLENEGIFNHEEFVKCVDRGEILKVKKFLLAGQEINARNSVEDTALIVAARNGDAHMVKLLLQQKGIDVNLRNRDKVSALLEAATLGHDDIRVLLELKDAKEPDLELKVARARLNRENIKFDKDSFFDAIRDGSDDLVELFIKAGMLPDVKDGAGNTALIIASDKGYYPMVKLLLENNADVNYRNNYNISALMAASHQEYNQIADLIRQNGGEDRDLLNIEFLKAVQRGDAGEVKATLEKGASPNFRGSEGEPPLITAVTHNYLEITESLLKHNASVNAKNSEGKTALMLAAEWDMNEMIKLLLQYNAKINEVTQDGRTALILAAWKGYTTAVQTLIDNKAALDITDSNGWSALAVAIKQNYADIVRILRNAGAREWDAPAKLFKAAYQGDVQKLKEAIDQKADSNMIDEDGNTPLMIAALRGWLDVVEELHSLDVDMNAKSKKGDTALILAACSGHVEVVRFLLDKGVDINAFNDRGRTALIEAAVNGRVQTVELLAQREARLDVKAKDGTTALIEACHQGSLGVVKSILHYKEERHEKMDERVRFGCTPLMTAVLAGHTQIVELLEDLQIMEGKPETKIFMAARRGQEKSIRELIQGLKEDKSKSDTQLKEILNARDKEGYTALMEAAAAGHDAIVNLLIESQSDINSRARNGDTALVLAASKGRLAVLKRLLQTEVDEKSTTNALVLAARNGHARAVRLLLEESNARINGLADNRVPLIEAARNGHIEVVRTMLVNGPDELEINKTDNTGKTALTNAILKGHQEIARILMERISDSEAEGVKGVKEANLILAAKEGDEYGIERLLKLKGIDLHAEDLEKRTALMMACKTNKPLIVKMLLTAMKSDEDRIKAVNASDVDKRTPLMYAAMGGSEKITGILLNYKANVSARSKTHRTALMEACKKGNLQMVKKLLKSFGTDWKRCKAEVNARDLHGNTPLKEALLGGHFQIRDYLLQKGANTGIEEARLLRAAKSCNIIKLQELLKKRVDVNTRDHSGNTPLILAAANNCNQGVKILISEGAEVNGSALILAAEKGYNQVVDTLLNHHADIDAATRTGKTALMEAAEKGKYDVLETLINNGASVNIADETGTTALMWAIDNEHSDIVDRLLEEDKTDIEAKDHKGRTSLLLAHLKGKHTGFNAADFPAAGDELSSQIQKEFNPIEKSLLNHGAREGWNEAELILAARIGDSKRIKELAGNTDLQTKDLKGKTALHISSASRDEDSTAALIQAGAVCDARCEEQRTPLMEAARGNHKKIVDILLTPKEDGHLPGVNVDARDINEDTALIEAVRAKSTQIVEKLIENGAGVNSRNKDGDTPLIEAVKTGATDVIKTLLNSKANACVLNSRHRTTIMEAAEKGQKEALEILLNHIQRRTEYQEKKRLAVINAIDREGHTALDLAKNKKHDDCVRLLKDNGGLSVIDTNLTVCITPTGECYHRKKRCGATKKAEIENTLRYLQIHDARAGGYDPCERCRPDYAAAHELKKGLSEHGSADSIWSC